MSSMWTLTSGMRAGPWQECETPPAKSYADLKRELDVTSNRTVWAKLKATFPGVRKVKQRIRRVRKQTAEVVVRALDPVLHTAVHDAAYVPCARC